MNVLTQKGVHPIALNAFLSRELGEDWWEWDALALRMDLEDGFTKSISPVVWSKIQALKTIYSTWQPWNAWEVFRPICDAFTDHLPDFFVLDPPVLNDMTFTARTMKRLDPEGVFGPEIARFVAASSHYWGQYLLPEDLGFAQEYAESWRYRCKTCDAEGSMMPDAPIDICPSCSGRYISDKPFSQSPQYQPVEEAAKKAGRGVLEFFPTYDIRPAREILNKLLTGAPVSLSDTEEADIQAVRAFAAIQYCNAKDKEL